MHNLFISYELTSPETNGAAKDLKQRAANGSEQAFLTAMAKVPDVDTATDDKLPSQMSLIPVAQV
jgi:hypothetical protein